MRRHRYLTQIGAFIATVSLMTMGGITAHAAGSTGPAVNGPRGATFVSSPGRAPSAVIATGRALANSLSGVTGTHYLYVDDGGCNPNANNDDYIYAYSVTSSGATQIQTFLSSADNCPPTNVGYWYGANPLGVVAANSSHGPCLVVTDLIGKDVQTYNINPSTGKITSAGGTVATGTPGGPDDVQPLNATYAAVTTHYGVNIVSVGASCVPKLTGHVTAPSGHEYVSGAWANSGAQFIEPDFENGGVDVYKFNANTGAVAFVKANSGILQSARSAASNGNQVFVGQDEGPPVCPMSGIVTSTGAYTSQQQNCENDGVGGSTSWWDGYNYLNGENYSAAIGIYSGCCHTSGAPFTSLDEAPLAYTHSYVQDFQQSGTTLFVDDGLGGYVDACVVAKNSVSSCSTILDIPVFNSGYSAGFALL